MEHKVVITITTSSSLTEDAVVEVEFTPPVPKEGDPTTVELAAGVMLAALAGTSKGKHLEVPQRKGEA